MDMGTIKLSEYLNPQYCPKLYLVMFDSLEAKTQLLHQVRGLGVADLRYERLNMQVI